MKYYNNSKYNLFIQKSNIEKAGRGVFTKEFIPNNTFLGYYEGELINRKEATSNYCYELSENYFIDAFRTPRSIFSMINDAKWSDYEYNCEFVNEFENFKTTMDHNKLVGVYTIKDIKENEELLVSYGPGYWTW